MTDMIEKAGKTVKRGGVEMIIKNCQDCGKIFVHSSRDLCPECYALEEEDFKKVREYLWEKSTSSVDDVHEKTGVPVKRIVKFIRTGRIGGAGVKVDLYLNCEGCGAPITEGRFCRSCRDRLVNGFTEEPAPQRDPRDDWGRNDSGATKQKGQMYISDRHRRR